MRCPRELTLRHIGCRCRRGCVNVCVDAAHLTTLTDVNQQMLDTADPAERAVALCKLMVGPQFKGRWAVVVRTLITAGDKPPQLLYEAHGALSNREPYLSRSVLRKV